jgi:hypothetical protein
MEATIYVRRTRIFSFLGKKGTKRGELSLAGGVFRRMTSTYGGATDSHSDVPANPFGKGSTAPNGDCSSQRRFEIAFPCTSRQIRKFPFTRRVRERENRKVWEFSY